MSLQWSWVTTNPQTLEHLVSVLNKRMKALEGWTRARDRGVYANISAHNKNATITIDGSGEGNKAQITIFDSNGASSGATPDHTNDHIVINEAADYAVIASASIESTGAGGADTFGVSVYKNDGNSEFENLHVHRDLAGGGGDKGSITMSGIAALAVDDTIEVWCWNEDNGDDLVVDDISLLVTRVGI